MKKNARDSPVWDVAATVVHSFLRQYTPVLMVSNNIKNSTYIPQQNQKLNQTTSFYNIYQQNQIKTLSTNFYDLSQI